jgi:Ni/Fe-hydrogenase 1 B-type cytochrome subunit
MTTQEERYWPARVMHYIHWICMVLLAVSGFYIHRPFTPGLMGTMRTIHFIAMYIVGFNLIARIYWAIFGTHGDIRRFLPEKENKGKLVPIVAYYLFLRREHPVTAKYNTLQKTTYNFWALLLVLQGITGFSLYWPHLSLFAALNNWVGGLLVMKMIHYLIMWVFIITTAIHVYLSLAEEFAQFLDMFFAVPAKKK